MALRALDPFNVKRVLERVGRVREEIAEAADVGFLLNARRARKTAIPGPNDSFSLPRTGT